MIIVHISCCGKCRLGFAMYANTPCSIKTHFLKKIKHTIDEIVKLTINRK